MAENIDNRTNKIMIDGKEGTVLGVEQIFVGVENPNEREILTDKTTGYNYSRTAVEAHEIYNLHTKKHSPWFILDLETGQNGWYPGCEIHGNTVSGVEVPFKKAPSDDAEEWGLLSRASVIILDIDTLDQEPYDKGWYKVLYDVEGYIRKDYIINLRYADPNEI